MSNNKLTAQERIEIANQVATSKAPNYEIAKQYGITATRVGQIAKQFKPTVDQAEQDAVYDAVQNATGREMLNKEWRMKQFERMYYKLDGQFTSDAVNAQTRILSEVAKELGDIAPSQHTVTGTVSHIIGIDPSRILGSPVERLMIEDGASLTAEVIEEISDGS